MKRLKHILPVLALMAAQPVLAEVVPGTTADIHFESANIVGTGRSINIHRVPVYADGSKTPVYFDASFKLSLDAKGNLVFDGFTKVAAADLNNNANFIPGKYKDQAGHEFTVSGGGVSGGRVMWSITGTKEFAFDVSWVTGAPIGNPLIATLAATPKLIEGQSYGIGGAGTQQLFNYHGSALIIGVSQSGKSITFTNYGFEKDAGKALGTFVITLVE